MLLHRELKEGVRVFALVRGEPGQTRHFAGPGEPSKPPFELPWPDVVLIETRPDGVFLFRFTSTGDDAGDTWHQTVEDAKAQAKSEYGHRLTSWRDVPRDESDAEAYVVKKASDDRLR